MLRPSCGRLATPTCLTLVLLGLFASLAPAEQANLPSPSESERNSTPDAARSTAYAIYLRAGLVEYLSERPAKAVEWFEKAKPFAPPRDFVVAHGTVPTGIEKLIDLAKSGKYITPEEVRQGDPKAKMILMLADVYHEGEEWQKSLDLCTRVIEAKGFKPTNQQKSWAHFKRGRNSYSMMGAERREAATAAAADYLAAVRAHPKAAWSGKALFLAANIQWNFHRDADGAAALWRQVIRDYPQCDEVDRSAFFIGVAYQASGRPLEARRAYEESLKKFPQSRFNKLVQEQLLKLDRPEAPKK